MRFFLLLLLSFSLKVFHWLQSNHFCKREPNVMLSKIFFGFSVFGTGSHCFGSAICSSFVIYYYSTTTFLLAERMFSLLLLVLVLLLLEHLIASLCLLTSIWCRWHWPGRQSKYDRKVEIRFVVLVCVCVCVFVLYLFSHSALHTVLLCFHFAVSWSIFLPTIQPRYTRQKSKYLPNAVINCFISTYGIRSWW